MVTHSRHALHQLRAAVNADPDQFSRNVYTRLFAVDPDLRDLFPATMSGQRDAFYRVIDHVLEVIPSEHGHAELIEFLAQLGRDHRKFGVLPEHYRAMYIALMGEFSALMAGFWDADTEQTVSQAMMLVTGVMRGAAETAPHPALWTAKVAEKYRISRDLAVVRLTTDAPLRFKPGQYLEVQVPQWPKAWRHLSPAIPPNPDGELEFHVRAVQGGTVSTAIVSDTRVGDVWFFAQGHGTLHVDPDRDVLMVAGGTGLAPLRALIIEMSKRSDSPRTHIFYGMRHPGELYDLAVLRRIAGTNPWLRVTAVSEETSDPWWINAVATPRDLGIEHRIGTLADVVADAGDWSEHQVLIAGSHAMIEATTRRLVVAGVRKSRIQHDPVD
ncbi:FAD-binding oxidoreductase [Gordonia sp. ABSL1-1]|uniref:FAD-binding oxidoreductase n=1 Tax=Gordonia sp. ABSL1-1 TaxID=3053923 RepID=UPI002572233C|nr:FAD-binding oxidoreductase [Gordonia sp. ABSL1-1]MDL9938914.1 FAD-binding oxidoreductase [Gordonia sp. ABSL1-1]